MHDNNRIILQIRAALVINCSSMGALGEKPCLLLSSALTVYTGNIQAIRWRYADALLAVTENSAID
jgi:hypothetical protein